MLMPPHPVIDLRGSVMNSLYSGSLIILLKIFDVEVMINGEGFTQRSEIAYRDTNFVLGGDEYYNWL